MNYNLSELFSKAFGIASPIFVTQDIIKENTPIFDFKGVKFLEDYHAPEATSWMGTPIIGLLKCLGGQYKIYNSSGIIEVKEMQDFIFPPATLFSFRRSKNITETELSGSDGSVKEIYGFSDWIIDVKGLAVDTPTESAQEQIKKLSEWEKLVSAINISGKLFTNKDIYSVTIYDYQDDSIQGSPGIIPFSMQMKSDKAILLILPDKHVNF